MDYSTTDREILFRMLEYHVDIGSGAKINSLKHLIVAHQTAVRAQAANKTKKMANFATIDVRKYFVEVDGVRCPKNFIDFSYDEID